MINWRRFARTYVLWAIWFAFLVLFMRACKAQDRPAPSPPPVVKQKEAPAARLTSRVLFLVDVSSSMSAEGFNRALAGLKLITQQPVDKLDVAVAAFGDHTYRWTYGKKKTKRWASLPDARFAPKATAWLEQLTAVLHGTIFRPALRYALREKVKDLTIVVLSDGLWHVSAWAQARTNGVERVCDWPSLAADLKAGQAWRKRKGYGPAVVMTLSTDPTTSDSMIRRLGRHGGGGCFELRKPRKAAK